MQLDLIPKQIPYKLPSSLEGQVKTWDLYYPISSNWGSAKQRFLFVIDHVPSENLKSRKLLSGETGEMFVNILSYAEDLARSWGCKRSFEDCGVAFVSWSYFKTYNLDKANAAVATTASVDRMERILKKLDPTHVHFFGEAPAQEMFGIDVEKRGWVLKLKSNIGKIWVSTNISVTNEAKFFEDDDDSDDEDEGFNDDALGVDKSNLLGYACNNLARILNGGYPYSLRHIKPAYNLIDTMKKWKKLHARLMDARCFAYDLETDNLSAMCNRILTAQFTLPDTPDMCEFLPLKHFDSPWSSEQLKEIYTDLRTLFAQKFDQRKWNVPYLIGQNLAFDLRVTRVELGIPVVYFRIWDLMAGEHAIDENLKAVNTKSVADVEGQNKNRPWALDSIISRYENDFYYTAEFGKSDRATISEVPLEEPLLMYGSMDTIGPMHVHLMQLERASHMVDDKGRPYLNTYKKLVLGVYSDTIHTQSHMMTMGVKADQDYIIKQFAQETSDIEKERDRLIAELYAMPSVKKANKKLLKHRSLPSQSLFSGTEYESEMWTFDITNTEHQRLLFFKVLDLKPVNFTAGGLPSLGKAFKNEYSKDGTNSFHQEVVLFKAIGEAAKVRGYIKGYYEKLMEPDGQYDGRIRASYGFVMVVTGRSNSFNPSFQQIPTHGRYAKMVKRCFVAAKGRVIIKMDYSAHEIGCWCIISEDPVLAVTFKTIWNNWVDFRLKPTVMKIVNAVQSDAHKLNYQLFTGTPLAEITKPLRQQSKGITFGAMYGQHVRTMAQNIGIVLEEMEKIYNKFFGKFAKAKAWLENTVKRARKNLHTFNPFGFRRNLFGYLSANRGLAGAMDRRAQNSPIQGFASQLGFIAARLLVVKLDTAFESEGMVGTPVWDKKNARFVIEYPPFNLNAMVHDSTEVETSYELAPLIAQAMEHCATNGLMEYCTRMYGLHWIIRPQVDFDIGDTQDKLVGWNFTQDFEPSEQPEYAEHKDEWDKLDLASSFKTCITKAWESHNARHPKAVKEKDMQLALDPSKRVQRMLKLFPLDLTPYTDLKGSKK